MNTESQYAFRYYVFKDLVTKQLRAMKHLSERLTNYCDNLKFEDKYIDLNKIVVIYANSEFPTH